VRQEPRLGRDEFGLFGHFARAQAQGQAAGVELEDHALVVQQLHFDFGAAARRTTVEPTRNSARPCGPVETRSPVVSGRLRSASAHWPCSWSNQ
jgi:hypothetical protein